MNANEQTPPGGSSLRRGRSTPRARSDRTDSGRGEGAPEPRGVVAGRCVGCGARVGERHRERCVDSGWGLDLRVGARVETPAGRRGRIVAGPDSREGTDQPCWSVQFDDRPAPEDCRLWRASGLRLEREDGRPGFVGNGPAGALPFELGWTCLCGSSSVGLLDDGTPICVRCGRDRSGERIETGLRLEVIGPERRRRRGLRERAAELAAVARRRATVRPAADPPRLIFELVPTDPGSEDPGFYFRIVFAGNGETLAHSEVYVDRRDALHAIELVKAGARTAVVFHVPEAS